MDLPKFLDTQLITYQDGVYKVLGLSSQGPGYHYRIILAAYQREPKVEESDTDILPQEIIVEESLLTEFKNDPPRFKFGEGVRLRGEINCVVKFIQYKNYSYEYLVKEKVAWTDELIHGWFVEESYLQKW